MKTIDQEILNKVFQKAAIEQTAQQYARDGYFVSRQARLGELRADLVAQKGGKLIVIEFKSGPWIPRKAKTVAKLRNYVVDELKGEFRLVLVNPPQEKQISVSGIEDILHQELLEDTSQVDVLATHVTFDEVTDVEIDSVDIDKERIDVIGRGNVTYELQYGSHSDMAHDEGLQTTETFPFTFRLYLNHRLEVDEVSEIDIDTSSFYE
jgi:hypothetical protein